jgi:hypothetical protein
MMNAGVTVNSRRSREESLEDVRAVRRRVSLPVSDSDSDDGSDFGDLSSDEEERIDNRLISDVDERYFV